MDELRKLQQQAQDAARSFESSVNEVGRSVEQEAAKIETTASLAAPETTVEAAANATTHAAPGSSAVADEIAALESSIAEQAASQNKSPVPFAQHSPAIAEAEAATAAKHKAAEDVR